MRSPRIVNEAGLRSPAFFMAVCGIMNGMKLLCLLLFVTMTALLQGSAVLAQEKGEDFTLAPQSSTTADPDFFSYFFQPQYNQIVRKAVLTWPKPMDFRQMRGMYMRTRQYDPMGEDTLKKLADLSYSVENTKDEKEKERKAGEIKDLVLDHLGNIDVVLQALSLARENPIYGDPAFYEWVVKGTEQEIMSSYTGRTMKRAYVLVTMGDEALVFNRLGAKSIHSELVSDGKKFYTIHLAEDLKTKKQFELYIDSSLPMRRLKAVYNTSGKDSRINIGKQ